MTLSKIQQEMLDHFQIEKVLIKYAYAIDDKCINDFDSIFTQDAVIDYSNFGGPKGNVKTIKSFLNENLNDLPKQHHITNIQIKVDGDKATSRCLCFNPTGMPDTNGRHRIAFFGLRYEDTLIRSEDGWKISSRVSKPDFNFNLPETIVPASHKPKL